MQGYIFPRRAALKKKFKEPTLNLDSFSKESKHKNITAKQLALDSIFKGQVNFTGKTNKGLKSLGQLTFLRANEPQMILKA